MCRCVFTMSLWSLRRKYIFVFGFVLGFTFAVFLVSDEDKHQDYEICKRRSSWLCNERRYLLVQKQLLSKPGKSIREEIAGFDTWMRVRANATYEAWLNSQNVRTTKLNMDYRQYGPDERIDATKRIPSEAEWLKSKVHVTCVVFVEKKKRAKAVLDSWGTSCNELYFFSERFNDTDLSIISFPMKLTSSWQMLCETMNYVWTSTWDFDGTSHNDALQWIIFVKDDTMVVPENLRYLVATLDFKDPHYLGHPVVLWGQAYNVAQAGFVLSRLAFRKIIENFDSHQKCISGGKYWKKDDYYLGKHLALLGIHPADTRDRHLRGVFHGYSLQTLLWGIARPGSYFTRALYPPGHECCSPRSVTFSTTEPDKMYTVNYMLYHLHVYARPAVYGNAPAPTPMAEEEIWKSALREEFNITDFANVDSDRYYKIWSSRYSGPEQLIRKNTWNSTNPRQFLPSGYGTKAATFD